ncbi:MAG: efflux RND transporter periplasmic adaptor subunit, partial [Gemmatimonadales bacterium]
MAVPLLAGATVLSGCGANTDAQSGDETAPPGVVARVINVEVTRVVTTDFIDYIRITGEAEALYDATVSAEESGSVVELLATKGAQVARGQALVRLDDAVLRAQVNEARASARFAEEQYERQGRLWETDSIGSELTYLQSRYAAEMAAARLEGLEARLAKTVIRAPVSGILDDRFVEVGEMATPGTPIVRVVNTNRVKVSGGVPERFAPYVARGDTARVVFDIMPDRELIGLISYVSSTVDERSRTFQIEVVLDNPNSVIKPHMVANVEVMRESSTDVIVVPQQVVLRSSDG